MGFCRRCGDIVSGTRCKCGGTAVGPSVNFNQTAADRGVPDRWMRTYVSKSRSPAIQSTNKLQGDSTVETPIPVRKFPRPVGINAPPQTTLGARVTSHIQSSLSQKTSDSSELVTRREKDASTPSNSSDILSDPYTSTLSKVYGSVLQPKESLKTFSCIVCSASFPPDATIYPDPADPKTTSRFLCRPCFTNNGGSKGDCMACSRPVLILSSEGGFIENAGRIWHKSCFRCDGCYKDVSNTPMVDLLGRPSCEDCFESCLKRPARDSPKPKRCPSTPERTERRSNPGCMRGSSQGPSRETSPTIEELHQRLGIKSRESSPLIERTGPKSREGSPLATDFSKRLSLHRSPEKVPVTDSTSPRGRYEKFRASRMRSWREQGSPVRSDKSDNLGSSIHSLRRSPSSIGPLSPTTSASRDSFSVSSSTPDLTDFSDTNTTSSAPSTPPSMSPLQYHGDVSSQKTPTKVSSPRLQLDQTPTKLTPNSPSTPCAKCSKPLLHSRSGGRFVTVPEESSKGLPPKCYHVDCFRCVVCDDPFEETASGQAVFVRSLTGCCHVKCVTPERIIVRPLKTKTSSTSLASSHGKQEHPPKTAPPTTTSFPRFGSGTTCPGCHISVSPMEKGVVPGPQGSKWHVSCLVCGGKDEQGVGHRDPNTPGCGKRLDSGARTDNSGGLWCRECSLLIPSELRSSTRQASPVRSMSSYTGGQFNRFPLTGTGGGENILQPQSTGTTTIARQFTGMSAMNTLAAQLTGSGLSPTRQLSSRSPSPTKMFSRGIGAGRVFPRPKSVIGARGKSIDEGRGMFLVRQMTGSGQGLGL